MWRAWLSCTFPACADDNGTSSLCWPPGSVQQAEHQHQLPLTQPDPQPALPRLDLTRTGHADNNQRGIVFLLLAHARPLGHVWQTASTPPTSSGLLTSYRRKPNFLSRDLIASGLGSMPLYMVSPLFHTLCGTQDAAGGNSSSSSQQRQSSHAVRITVLKTLLREQHLQHVLSDRTAAALFECGRHPSRHAATPQHAHRIQGADRIRSGVHT